VVMVDTTGGGGGGGSGGGWGESAGGGGGGGNTGGGRVNPTCSSGKERRLPDGSVSTYISCAYISISIYIYIRIYIERDVYEPDDLPLTLTPCSNAKERRLPDGSVSTILLGVIPKG